MKKEFMYLAGGVAVGVLGTVAYQKGKQKFDKIKAALADDDEEEDDEEEVPDPEEPAEKK